MKKVSSKFLSSKILNSYIVSYIGVVLMALALLSILSAWQVSKNMREENLRVTRDKLFVAAEDIESQMELMRNTAIQIAATPNYRTTDFEEDKYKEIELVKDLKRYHPASFISDFFFLKYSTISNIYTSEGTTLPLEVYGKRVEEAFRTEAMEQIVALAVDPEVNYCLIQTEEDELLLIYPLSKYSASRRGLNGVLCFEINRETVEKRIQQMAGILNGDAAVYYKDILISNAAEAAEEEPALLVSSMEGDVQIVFYQNEGEYFRWTNMASAGSTVILVIMVIFILGLAVLMAWKNYIPIRNLIEKYKRVSGNEIRNELEDLDSLIETLLQKEEKNNKLLQQQYYALREQALRLISAGEYSEKIERRLDVLNIHLPGPVYGKIQLLSAVGENGKQNEEIVAAIEDLADEGLFVYAFAENEKTIVVLVSAEEEYRIEELGEALFSLLETEGRDSQMILKAVCRDLKKINQIAFAEKEEEEMREEKEDEISLTRQARKVKRVITYIEENCTDYDLSLDSIAREFQVTSAYLCRLIKQETGISYKEYLTKLRMTEAKKLLDNPEANITEICQKVGYSNVSHFIKTFQRYEGITPAKYRDRV